MVATMEDEMTRFEVGKTYRTRSICDHDCIYEFKVVARSAKTITIESDMRGVQRRGVYIGEGWNSPAPVESCKPFGTYSMCPVIRADRENVK
jgi:hypothetical protein